VNYTTLSKKKLNDAALSPFIGISPLISSEASTTNQIVDITLMILSRGYMTVYTRRI